MIFYPLTILGNTENSVMVKPRERKTILELKVPNNMVAFLQLLEIDKWFPETSYEVYIDGELVCTYRREGRYIYDPPYVAKKSIRIVGINQSNEELPMGVFIDGVILVK